MPAQECVPGTSSSCTLNPAAKGHWLPLPAHLARVSRQLGLEDEARQIEDELRRLLAHADPDFAILRQLEASAPDAGQEQVTDSGDG